MTERPERTFAGYECVDPELGAYLAELGDADPDPDTQRDLHNHLLICDACRLQQAARKRIAAGLQDGTYHLDGADTSLIDRYRPPRWSAWLALAACLALVFVLPPRPLNEPGPSRAPDSDFAMTRPVEGEYLLAGSPRLAWHPLAEASGYRITVASTDGTYRWQETTRANEIRIPADVPLPAQTRFLALLEPIPADLGPDGGLSVSFRTTSTQAWIWYRLQAASPVLLAVMGLALILIVAPVRIRAS